MTTMLQNKSDVKLDIACRQLESLIRNPYAIERREKRIKEEREYVRKAWGLDNKGGKK